MSNRPLVERSDSEVSVGAMTERLLSTASQTFPVKREIPANVLKMLIDKNYDKRKQAGNELHKILTVFVERGNFAMIRNAVDLFRTEYIENNSDVLKKAGLMAFSALSSTIMLSDDLTPLVSYLINPVLFCFRDPDSKIRYAAVESMYNISKICRSQVLLLFDQIFKPMTELFADNDLNVKKAVEKLDLLLKTLIVECEADGSIFNSFKFMTLVKEMLITSHNANVQILLISWVVVLDSIPNYSVVSHLHCYFEGLFNLLGSRYENVRKVAYNFSKDLLIEVLAASHGEYDLLFVMETLSKFSANSDENVRTEAIVWTSDLLDKSDKVLFKIFPTILKSALQCIADKTPLIAAKASKVNTKLMKFMKTTSRETTISQYEDIVDIFMVFINHESIVTQKVTLEWILALQAILPESIESKLGILLDSLAARLPSATEVIFESILQVLCKVAEYKGYFTKVIHNLLRLFCTNSNLMQEKAKMMIKVLCQELGTEKVLQNFANLLLLQSEQKFRERMIAIINDLLLTDASLEALRERLKSCLEREDEECIELFEILFKTWCQNPVSALCLTFLVQAYELSYEILQLL
jgi:vacuole morphology and inheritance protein 14